ncbi:hypothetical protein PR048_030838 [Dryococelus australis]|uniref:Uncharacterized protein n=1 Tax=Dryococelus australis TaxID=614101 RepID=A0ABQ9GDW9_9NEOP|nr:hypothetical protein PR048_030838 [Dryococelus australis]
MEQCWNAKARETGDPEKTRGIIRHDTQVRKSGSDPALVGGGQSNRCTTVAPRERLRRKWTKAWPILPSWTGLTRLTNQFRNSFGSDVPNCLPSFNVNKRDHNDNLMGLHVVDAIKKTMGVYECNNRYKCSKCSPSGARNRLAHTLNSIVLCISELHLSVHCLLLQCVTGFTLDQVARYSELHLSVHWLLLECVTVITLDQVARYSELHLSVHWLLLECVTVFTLDQVARYSELHLSVHWLLLQSVTRFTLDQVARYSELHLSVHWLLLQSVTRFTLDQVARYSELHLSVHWLLLQSVTRFTLDQVARYSELHLSVHWLLLECVTGFTLDQVARYSELHLSVHWLLLECVTGYTLDQVKLPHSGVKFTYVVVENPTHVRGPFNTLIFTDAAMLSCSGAGWPTCSRGAAGSSPGPTAADPQLACVALEICQQLSAKSGSHKNSHNKPNCSSNGTSMHHFTAIKWRIDGYPYFHQQQCAISGMPNVLVPAVNHSRASCVDPQVFWISNNPAMPSVQLQSADCLLSTWQGLELACSVLIALPRQVDGGLNLGPASCRDQRTMTHAMLLDVARRRGNTLRVTGFPAGIPDMECTGMQWRGEYLEKTRRQAASSSTIPTCEDPGANPPEIEPGSSGWEADALTTAPLLVRTETLCAFARRSDEPLGVRVSVARIAPSLLDLGRAATLRSGELLGGSTTCFRRQLHSNVIEAYAPAADRTGASNCVMHDRSQPTTQGGEERQRLANSDTAMPGHGDLSPDDRPGARHKCTADRDHGRDIKARVIVLSPDWTGRRTRLSRRQHSTREMNDVTFGELVGAGVPVLGTVRLSDTNGAAGVQWLDYSPPTKVIRVRMLESCRWSADFLGGLPFPPDFAFRCRSVLASLHPHRLSRPRC